MRNNPHAITASFTLALLLTSPLHAETAAPPAGTVPITIAPGNEGPVPKPWLYQGSDVPVDTSWTFGELPNGLRYAVKNNVVPSGQVSIRVRVDAGALHEEDSELGFAHLIEHLSFRGSTFVPDGEAKRIWQRFGVTFGSDSNAQTTPTQTVYKLDLPNAQPATLAESMKVISGMIRNPRIEPTPLNAERAIVLAELREGGGAQQVFGDALREHMFQGQRLAKRSTIGTPQTLQAATAPALQAFHDRWYRPDNVTIVIAGDAEPAKLAEMVKSYFGDWKAEGPKAQEPDFGKPQESATPARIVVEPTLPTTINLAYLKPWVKVDDTIVYNEQILIDLLAAQIINRRLEVAARSGGSYLLAQVQQEDISRSADTTLVSITPTDDWEKAVKDVRAVIADATTTAPSQVDIDREKTLFANALRTGLDSYPFEAAAKQADEIVDAVDIRETVATPKTVVDVYNAMSDKFTPQRLLDSTKKLFSGSATRIIMSAPAAQANGDVRLASALSADVKAASGVRLADKPIKIDDLPKLGTPGKVVATKNNEQLEMTRVELSNGVRVLMNPNKAESGQVRVLVRFGNGYQSVAPENGGLLWAGPMIVSENGIGKFKQTQLDQLFNGRRIELNFGIDNDAFEYSASTRTEDLADQLKIIATKMENPGWDAGPIQRAKALITSGYDSFSMSANSIMQRDLQYLLSNRDLRFKSPNPQDVKPVDADSFRKYWEPLLAQGPVEVLLFGDFDQTATTTALQNTFGAMKPRSESPKPPAALKMTFPAANTEPMKLTHRGPADQAAAIIAWPTAGGLDKITEGRELEILAAVFRDRLFEKFRSEQAASYSPDMANNWPEEFDTGGYLMAYSQVRPQDVDSFYKFADEVAKDLVANPVSADELQRAVEPIKQYVDRASSGNIFWQQQLEDATYDQRKFVALSHLYTDYTGVTPAKLQELAKRYFVADKAWKLVIEPQGEGPAVVATH